MSKKDDVIPMWRTGLIIVGLVCYLIQYFLIPLEVVMKYREAYGPMSYLITTFLLMLGGILVLLGAFADGP